ncbi:MAG: hypothetical protein A2Y23_07060 [Clostridiales bacterium GWB2_37_7]|nr:MAG: hypothetical protein A2Y23_07060 [Clostridiales bacterium GWB2_37_7]
MDNMQDMGYQMPYSPAAQQPFYNQMPTMPMQPIQPMTPMGTVTGITTTPAGGVQEFPGTTSGAMPTSIASVPLPSEQFGEDPVMDTEYTQGYLRTQIGKKVKVEFLLGTSMLVDREGTLVDVGISYIIINEVETDDLLLCDIYSIKFVRIYF